MSKTRDREEFIALMSQEYPQLPRGFLLDTLRSLLRLSARHARLQEQACNEEIPEGRDTDCEERIRQRCALLPGCEPIFSGDPRGCTVKLKVPSATANDFGGVGVCVPQ